MIRKHIAKLFNLKVFTKYYNSLREYDGDFHYYLVDKDLNNRLVESFKENDILGRYIYFIPGKRMVVLSCFIYYYSNVVHTLVTIYDDNNSISICSDYSFARIIETISIIDKNSIERLQVCINHLLSLLKILHISPIKDCRPDLFGLYSNISFEGLKNIVDKYDINYIMYIYDLLNKDKKIILTDDYFINNYCIDGKYDKELYEFLMLYPLKKEVYLKKDNLYLVYNEERAEFLIVRDDKIVFDQEFNSFTYKFLMNLLKADIFRTYIPYKFINLC